MENPISISNINDFLFCPASIYYHNLVNGVDSMAFQSRDQIEGTHAHAAIEEGRYSSRSNILQAAEVYSEEYGVVGRIDLYDVARGILTERKKHVSIVYPGYVMQLYGQCICLREMGYEVKGLRIHSMDDNRIHAVPLPEDSPDDMRLFVDTLDSMRSFDVRGYRCETLSKCSRCIYRPVCGSTDFDDV